MYSFLKKTLIVLISILSFKSFSQQFYSFLDDYYDSDSSINISKLRNVSDFLTNKEIKQIDSYLIPKRKKAFKRYVKEITEKIENLYVENKHRSNDSEELIYILYLMDESFRDKILSENSRVTISDKFRMASATFFSPLYNTYKISVLNNEDVLKPSIYYNNVSDSLKHPYKSFSKLAREKKINYEKEMVLVFDKFSFDGSAPKIHAKEIKEDSDNKWVVKWGDEIHSDPICSRIFAALGYDIDHPYYMDKNMLTLVFDDSSNINDFIIKISSIYKIDITYFISEHGVIDNEIIKLKPELAKYINNVYIRFNECAIEARPDRVKRLGSFIHNDINKENIPLLRGAILAHHFIGNWDIRKENTLLTQVHTGNHNYKLSAVFSDLGTSLGVDVSYINKDFKASLINQFDWEVIKIKKKKIKFKNKINSFSSIYSKTKYSDLLFVANRLAKIDSLSLRKMVKKGGYPEAIELLYFHKLASRRANILEAFNIFDPNPIAYDRKLTFIKNGKTIIKDGVLLFDYKKNKHPESLFYKKGRFRNYAH